MKSEKGVMDWYEREVINIQWVRVYICLKKKLKNENFCKMVK